MNCLYFKDIIGHIYGPNQETATKLDIKLLILHLATCKGCRELAGNHYSIQKLLTPKYLDSIDHNARGGRITNMSKSHFSGVALVRILDQPLLSSSFTIFSNHSKNCESRCFDVYLALRKRQRILKRHFDKNYGMILFKLIGGKWN